MKPHVAILVALELAFVALCGCATTGKKTAATPYVVIVSFIAYDGSIPEKFEITANPNVPFAVKTEDAKGNHYEARGTLRALSKDTVRWESFALNYPMSSTTASYMDIHLNEPTEWRTVATIVQGGYRVEITKK